MGQRHCGGADRTAVIVDSQVHVWAEDRPWPPGTGARAHRKVALGAEPLLAEMAAAGVDRAILVPPSYEGDRNDLVLAAAQRWPDRFGAMVRIPMRPPMSRDALAAFCAQPGLLGLRLTFHLPHQRVWLEDGSADWFWPLAEALGIRVMVLPVGSLDRIAAIAERHPGLRIAIDHFSHHRSFSEAPRIDQAEIAALVALARFPSVMVKASCLPFFSAEPYPFRDLDATIRRVFDAFGPRRMFWGSDMTRLACPYRQAVTHFTEELPWLQGEARALVMGRALLDWLDWR
jgi:predicted TIM-barrel fold metal-dependent hydrolase